jgi:hypothetical protein
MQLRLTALGPSFVMIHPKIGMHYKSLIPAVELVSPVINKQDKRDKTIKTIKTRKTRQNEQTGENGESETDETNETNIADKI